VRRECRGLTFAPDGRLISRPFHKFFNVGERGETQPDLVDLAAPHVILEKLDGSMIRPIPIGDGYRLGTKMGVTDVARQAEAFVARRPEHDRLMRAEMARGHTPIFEWCSRWQRIVVDHPEDRLVLLAVRENRSGRYLSLEEMAALVDDFPGVELVRTYPGSVAALRGLLAGVTRHRALTGIGLEKEVVAILAASAADDVKALLPPEPRARLEAFEQLFYEGFGAEVTRLQALYADIRARVGDDRKGFALGEGQSLAPAVRSLMFQAWEGRDVAQELLKMIVKSCGSSTRLEGMRWAWGGHRWSFDFDADA
jgi:RNA ligase